MPASEGSYALSHMRDPVRELARLRTQAKAAVELERRIWEMSGLEAGMRVLDVACGPGLVSCELAQAVGAEVGEVVGVDLDPGLVTEARSEAARQGQTSVSFRQGNVYDLDKLGASFDFAYARMLFQHLAEPRRALASIRRTLRPGGRLCIADVDDAWLLVHPGSTNFESFAERAARGQRALGGDREVGRKLPEYLAQTGYTNVRTRVFTVTSYDLGMQRFLDLTTGFKLELVPAAERDAARAELERAHKALDRPDAWGAVAVFVATGDKWDVHRSGCAGSRESA